jgi:uncharacterized membrane protein YjdF
VEKRDGEKKGKFSISWEDKVILVLRTLSIVVGVFEFFLGEHVIGFFILLAVVAITLPGIMTRNFIKFIPHEFELLFFIMVILQLIVGETLNFHDLVPYYDKFVHFSLPLFVGLMGFLLAYTLQKTGNLNMTTGPMIVLIVLITLGIGAIWEIIEYLYDTFIYSKTDAFGRLQGTLTESPLVDTMLDLIANTIGGLFGAIIGLRYIKSEQGKRDSKLSILVDKIADNFRKKEPVS